MSRQHPSKGVIPTSSWLRKDRAFAEALVDRVLAGLGDPDVQRAFRMCSTICRHRVLTRAERAELPDYFTRFRPVHLAGSPIEVLWTKGIPAELDAARACDRRQTMAIPGHARARVPDPCGECASCRANDDVRAALDSLFDHGLASPLTTR